ncbi:MAG TPA: hypothetical protein VHQ43_10830 [Solirubrobacterales bacterium]|nr:hypothetical protein [Solirubrobacterales bacterium]
MRLRERRRADVAEKRLDGDRLRLLVSPGHPGDDDYRHRGLRRRQPAAGSGPATPPEYHPAG